MELANCLQQWAWTTQRTTEEDTDSFYSLLIAYLCSDPLRRDGLDDLAKRCAEYRSRGCRFAKWRAPVKIGDSTPSVQAIQDTATVLARYASICQSEGLVPIVTPGQGHSKNTPQDIAAATITAFLRTIPAAVPEDATLNLDAINRVQRYKPWTLTFSYGRALQASVWKTWAGEDENVNAAQRDLLKRAKANGLASQGKYTTQEACTVTSSAAKQSNFRQNHTY
ncbi:Fructose-bisphosphate aldolase [Operophtera brumata]|uniref:fructose-bisphosphate aldolase n=1 Tax=Operophtera brumata TaxID=104452 RepID=A0A0L7LHP9_OPEBR|nr:Fructose-bisphosphate aldolase [Operophtera brumata]